MGTRTGARRIFIALILIALGLVVTLILPFGAAFVFATVLAGALAPLHKKLTKKFGNRPNLSASLLCVGVLLLLLLPLGGLGAFIVTEALSGVKFVTETVQGEGMTALIERLPDWLSNLARRGLGMFATNPDDLNAQLKRQAGEHGPKVARLLSGALAATGNAVIQGTMTLIALFFLLVDGKQFVAWIEDNSPLMQGQVGELLAEFRKVSTAVLVSSVVTSGVQALAALVGYGIAGVPQPFFFALVTFFLAFVPAIGAGSVCVTAALLLLALGKTWAAVFLAGWGLIVVALVDNWVKPLLVKRDLHMHGGIVFFSLFGGMTAFGAVGLLLGPLIVTFLLALVRIYKRDFAPSDDEAERPGASGQDGAGVAVGEAETETPQEPAR